MNQWQKAKDILCIRLDAMGDLLMSTPAIKHLKEAVPNRKITLLTSKEGSYIAPSIGLFDEVIIYNAPWLKSSEDKNDPSDDLLMIKKLKELEFDGAVIFTVYSQNPLPTALLCYLAEIPLRAAYCRENPYGLLSDWIKEEEPQAFLRHEVRRHLDLVEKLTLKKIKDSPLVLNINSSAQDSLLTKLHKEGVSKNDFENMVVVHPGSTASSRRFHTAGFAEVCELLVKSRKKVLFTGTEGESHLVIDIASKMPSGHETVNLSGKLSLEELIALIGLSPVLVSNNSGPVHIAAAVGTPVVDIYALTNPQHTPWMVKHSLLFHQVSCAYCYKSTCPLDHNNCINLVSPKSIYQETLELLNLGESMGRDESAVVPILLKEDFSYGHTRK